MKYKIQKEMLDQNNKKNLNQAPFAQLAKIRY